MLVEIGKKANMEYVCLASLVFYDLRPGDSTTFQVDFSVQDVLGDSLPTGTYRFSGLLGVSGLKNNVLPAGELNLGATSSFREP